jgi:aminopeptidase N
MKSYFLALGVLFSLGLTAQVDIMDSGGPLMPEQASYDVSFYNLELAVDPAEKYISGKVIVVADVVQPMDVMVLDLDTLLAVTTVHEVQHQETKIARNFSRRGGKIYIPLGHTRQVGAEIRIQVAYEGHPRVAPRAPWDGGFTWAKTPAGADWIATTCQTNGADLWWPCKDHVSDEPDSMALHITVPQPLVVASNGRLNRIEAQADASVTYHWDITNPINIYNVALNIAPYRTIEETFTSVNGDEFPFVFYVLPEDYEKGLRLFPELKAHLAFF